jgi:hypothetical protein
MKHLHPMVVKRVGQAVAGFGLLFATALAFQNCSGYQVYDISEAGDFTSTSGPVAYGLKSSTGSLTVYESSLTSYRFVDIGGYCDNGGFSSTEIQYLTTQKGNTTWASSSVACDSLGRFQIKIPVQSDTAANAFNVYIRLKTLGTGADLPPSPSQLIQIAYIP